MVNDWTPEQHDLRKRYLAIGDHIAQSHANRPEGFDLDGWNQLRDEKIWHLVVPAEYGGSGDDWWSFTAALDGLSTSIRNPELLLSVIGQASMVRALTRYGSTRQRDHYLTAILRGEISAIGIAEPTTGTDARSIETALSETSTGYRLQGSKYNIAHAPNMDFVLVVSRFTKRETGEITLLLLDRDTPGVEIGPSDDKLGNRNLPTGQIYFNGVEVEPWQVLGQPGRGLGHLIDITSIGRLYFGLAAANLLTPFVADAMAYIATRMSFKSTIDAHQYIQKRLVDMKIGMERTRWLAYGALAQLLNGQPDAPMTCSMAKLTGCEALIEGATSLVKLYGSVGYHNGRIATLVRDALGFASLGGTEEMHRKNIFNLMQRQKTST